MRQGALADAVAAVEQLHAQVGARVAAGVAILDAPGDLVGGQRRARGRRRQRRSSSETGGQEQAHGRARIDYVKRFTSGQTRTMRGMVVVIFGKDACPYTQAARDHYEAVAIAVRVPQRAEEPGGARADARAEPAAAAKCRSSSRTARSRSASAAPEASDWPRSGPRMPGAMTSREQRADVVGDRHRLLRRVVVHHLHRLRRQHRPALRRRRSRTRSGSCVRPSSATVRRISSMSPYFAGRL